MFIIDFDRFICFYLLYLFLCGHPATVFQ